MLQASSIQFLFQRCAGADALSDEDARKQLDEAASILSVVSTNTSDLQKYLRFSDQFEKITEKVQMRK